MAKAKQSAAASIIEAAKANRCLRGPESWITSLPQEHRDTLLEIARAWQSGELRGIAQKSDLHREFVAATGVQVSYQTFRRVLTPGTV